MDNTHGNNAIAVGDYIQDIIGHWYRVLDVQARGWRLQVDQVYLAGTEFRSYGYRPIVMGRSDFKPYEVAQ